MKTFGRKVGIDALRIVLIVSCFNFVCMPAIGQSDSDRPNVLFISLDDLGPILGCYGDDQALSPNIDRLADSGMLFERAYCQVAICNPSRASLLTGLRPDTVGVHDLVTHFREKWPDIVTLPEHFRKNGYHTQAFGKIFHPAFKTISRPGRPDLSDPQSWSVPIWRGTPPHYVTEAGVREAKAAFTRSRVGQNAPIEDWVNWNVRGFACEAPDVPDNRLNDGLMTDKALVALRELAREGEEGDKPFFLAVGYLKPHLPYVAPKKYWDLYDRNSIRLTDNDRPPRNAPPIALQVHWSGIRAQTDIPNEGAVSDEKKRELRHGYYACVSYVDAQIGRILDELDRLGLSDNTIVCLWGDHGYSLGEHAIWAKLTNFEHSARSPLIMRVPGYEAGQSTDALVEFVDLFPSLCELTGLSVPSHVEGSSFAPLFGDPDRPWKSAAFTQYRRRGMQSYSVEPLDIPAPASYRAYPETATMGYSMRTDRYRFTIWRAEQDPDDVIGIELYDHLTDPRETVNLASEPGNAILVAKLASKLERGWQAARPPEGSFDTVE